jgi:hypothetical protein
MVIPSIRFGSGRGGIRSLVIGYLICVVLRRGDRDLARKLIGRL